MKKKILSILDFDDSYDTDSVIQINGILYSSYVGRDIDTSTRTLNSLIEKYKSGRNNEKISDKLNEITYIESAKPRIIVGCEPIIEKGYFIYNHSNLLDKIYEFGKKLFNVLSMDEIKQYIFKLNDKFFLDSTFYPLENANTKKINIIFELFNEFGFPFSFVDANPNVFPCSLIENKIIPSLLTIYIVFSIYKSLDYINHFFSNNDEMEPYSILNKAFVELYSMEQIFNDKIEKFFRAQPPLNITKSNIDRVPAILTDYENTFINIINIVKDNFKNPKLLISNAGLEDYHVPISNNIFELAWYICYTQNLTNISIDTHPRCRDCGKIFTKKTDDVYCQECRKKLSNVDNQNITKNNKKKRIIEILNKYKNYIFFDDLINQKIIELKLLRDSGHINNIDNHNWQIKKDLRPLEKEIELAIQKNEYNIKG